MRTRAVSGSVADYSVNKTIYLIGCNTLNNARRMLAHEKELTKHFDINWTARRVYSEYRFTQKRILRRFLLYVL